MSRVPSLAEARRRAEATRRVKPDIEAASGPAAIRALREAIDAGKIPSTYVSSGRVVAVEKVSGTAGAAAGDEDSPLPVTASEVRRAGTGGAARRAHQHLPDPQPQDPGREHRDLRGGGHPAGAGAQRRARA